LLSTHQVTKNTGTENHHVCHITKSSRVLHHLRCHNNCKVCPSNAQKAK